MLRSNQPDVAQHLSRLASIYVRGRASSCYFRHFLPVERSEINRVDIERRKAAVPDGIRDDLPGERKQQPWTFDHDHRVLIGRRNILQTKDASVIEFEFEEKVCALTRGALKQDFDFEIRFSDLFGVYIDLDRDIGRLILRS